ncbi:histidine phosphatase family protein [Fictibacillus sp. 26RED30]|uniref:histidine phosphatase family protein n=1 Tax=Fictibacillus sp. 26RED30 TaxID=2745877 RepID=UPI0018CCC25B|nr:histidine phosphatase family protein [Fictibacillus sp. 26RED30]MBH0159215.1 histidine phosphatase family protein [Fictibacillus sp. 26RED30]
MSTTVYMVRHGDSPKEGNERTRGLTEKGYEDARRVTELLRDKKIDVVVSSPYLRSILTVEQVALHTGKEVMVMEDLRERVFSSSGNRLDDKELGPLLEKSFADFTFYFENGESNAACQKRAVLVLKELLRTYQDKNMVIGTHGAVMTLMMNYFNSSFDIEFLYSTTKPDIYRLEFNNENLVSVERVWDKALTNFT